MRARTDLAPRRELVCLSIRLSIHASFYKISQTWPPISFKICTRRVHQWCVYMNIDFFCSTVESRSGDSDEQFNFSVWPWDYVIDNDLFSMRKCMPWSFLFQKIILPIQKMSSKPSYPSVHRKEDNKFCSDTINELCSVLVREFSMNWWAVWFHPERASC